MLQALAGLVSDADRAAGCIYPDIANIRAISLTIAKAVAKKVHFALSYMMRTTLTVLIAD